MIITLYPQRRDTPLEVTVAGDVLSLNGATLDLGAVPPGATLPVEAVECEWLAGPIERVGDVLHVALALPHGARAPHETLFAQPITVTGDGPVALPPYAVEEEQA